MVGLRTRVLLMTAVFICAVALSFAQTAETASVEVSDQSLADGTVTIDRVVSDGEGWIVIHADDEGKPGQVIGYTQVANGENRNIQVQLDSDVATETLYAMLHEDAGEPGTYEFPGPDAPVQLDGNVVMTSFTAR